MSPPTPAITVVACIIERAHREVLICRPAKIDNTPRLWEFPTGLKGARESHEAAMRRVCKRRVGVNVAIHTGQPPFVADYDGRPAAYRLFVATVKSGEARPADYDEVRWVQAGQLCEYHYAKTTQDVIDWYVA